MNATYLILLILGLFFLAYKFYGGFISKKIFDLDDRHKTPAHKLRDNIDYVPARKSVLFSHHFVTIAGLGPILGPAIAVIWGWLPGLLWIVFGSIFVGAVHDLSALVISIRYDGRSIGDVAKDLIGSRARVLLLIIVFFALSLAMGVFALVISTLFSAKYYPQVVIPSGSLIFIAMAIGYMVHKKNVPIFKATLLGIFLMAITIIIGVNFPIVGVTRNVWIFILLVYAFFASCIPVWLLLQPRDYLNSFQLYLVMGLMYLGIFITQPKIVAPAINTTATDLPALFPFLFIVVACGAVSGFHSIVSSGTTARQLNKEKNAQAIGYGGMILEGVLAVVALIACTAGFKTAGGWHSHYAGWNAASGLGPKLDAFITGAGNFLYGLGIPTDYGRVIVTIVVIGFALTTLDSGTRLLRYNVEDLGRCFHIRPLQNRFTASFIAVFAIGFFALMKIGMTLWELFGMTNQLLAGLCLLIAAIYLIKRQKPIIYVIIPMIFVFIVSFWAMIIKFRFFWIKHNWILCIVGGVIFILAIWLVTEGVIQIKERKKHAVS